MRLPSIVSNDKRFLLDLLGRSDSLQSRVVWGSLWSIGTFGFSQTVRFVSNVILARLLAPEAFGLMALVHVVLRGTNMLSDVGIAPNVIQSPRGDNPSFLATAWTIQILRGGILALVCVGLAHPVASFYEQDELTWLLIISSLVLLISAWNSTNLLIMSRRMEVRALSLLEVASQIMAVVVMLSWAWVRPSVWALVAGAVASVAVRLVGSYVAFGRSQDRFCWDPEAAREILSFGRWIFVSTTFAFFATELDRLIFGKAISISQLGVYSIAATIAIVPAEVLNRLAGSIVLPAYSRALREGRALGTIYHRLRFPLCSIGGLIVAFLIASAEEIISVLYDDRYAEAGSILQVLAFGSWFVVLISTNGSLLLSVGLPRLLAMCNAAKVLGMIVLIPLGFEVGGFRGAVFGIVFAEAIKHIVSIVAVTRQGIDVWRRDLAMTAFVAFSAWVSGAAGAYVAASSAVSWLSIPASAAVAALLWAGPLWLSLRYATSAID